MRGPAQLATYVAISMILAGFLVIGLAWNGAASLDYIQGQFPYLLSGGLGGLGLIVAGMAIMYVQTTRTLAVARSRQMDRINAEARRVLEVLREDPLGPAAGAHTLSSNGSGPATGTTVVAGRSSFHDPECHLVASRDDLERIARDQAASRGLNACRICKP
jgi:hypothetical protein